MRYRAWFFFPLTGSPQSWLSLFGGFSHFLQTISGSLKRTASASFHGISISLHKNLNFLYYHRSQIINQVLTTLEMSHEILLHPFHLIIYSHSPHSIPYNQRCTRIIVEETDELPVSEVKSLRQSVDYSVIHRGINANQTTQGYSLWMKMATIDIDVCQQWTIK